MMKYIILLALLKSLVQVNFSQNIQIVSTDFVEHDQNYNLNLMRNEKEECEKEFETLNLNNMHLHVIKNNTIYSNSIQHISLYNNNLENIYAILDYVPNLSCLNLSRNEINIYNENIIRHIKLKTLDLSYQKVPETNDLQSNIYEDMIFNTARIILPDLEYLDLSGNEIFELQWGFNVSFPQLRQLDLINIKADIIEPTFFDKIPNSLRVLHLENNYFHNITLQNMANVIALYLDGNPFLKTINIVSEKLKILSLSNCASLIEGQGTFDVPNLEELDLSKNNFKTISTISFEVFQSLRILLLDNNELSQFPLINYVQRLNELSLNFNMIKNIPSDIFVYFPLLKKLSLRGNEIERIEEDSFLSLNNLEYLNLSGNKLKGLPYNWAMSLNLQYLNVNSNQFANILNMAINWNVKSLKYLSVKNNLFTEITTRELAYLPNSTTVYIA